MHTLVSLRSFRGSISSTLFSKPYEDDICPFHCAAVQSPWWGSCWNLSKYPSPPHIRSKKKHASFPSRCAWGSSKDAFHLNSISEYASFQCSCDQADTPVHTAAEHGCLGESTCGRGCGLTPLPGSVHRHVYPE